MAYTERLVASPLVCCTWEQTAEIDTCSASCPTPASISSGMVQALTIAGPDTSARLVRIRAGAPFVGARLRPGAAGAVLGLPADELCDASPDAADVLGAGSRRAHPRGAGRRRRPPRVLRCALERTGRRAATRSSAPRSPRSTVRVRASARVAADARRQLAPASASRERRASATAPRRSRASCASGGCSRWATVRSSTGRSTPAIRRPGAHDGRGHPPGRRAPCPISQRPHAHRRVAFGACR